MIAEFHDGTRGGFFYVGTSHETLIARQKDPLDNATPASNAMAATALARLAALTGRTDFDDLACSTLLSAHRVMERMPTAAGQSLVRARLPPRPGSGICRDRPARTGTTSDPPSRPSPTRSTPTRSSPPLPGRSPRHWPTSSRSWPSDPRKMARSRPTFASGSPARPRWSESQLSNRLSSPPERRSSRVAHSILSTGMPTISPAFRNRGDVPRH